MLRFYCATCSGLCKKEAKVTVNGVKINYLFYWNDVFRNPQVEDTSVPVRYDPYDVGFAWALVNNQWHKCISQYHALYAGRTEKEVEMASQDLLKMQKITTQHRLRITAKTRGEYLNSLASQELQSSKS